MSTPIPMETLIKKFKSMFLVLIESEQVSEDEVENIIDQLGPKEELEGYKNPYGLDFNSETMITNVRSYDDKLNLIIFHEYSMAFGKFVSVLGRYTKLPRITYKIKFNGKAIYIPIIGDNIVLPWGMIDINYLHKEGDEWIFLERYKVQVLEEYVDVDIPVDGANGILEYDILVNAIRRTLGEKEYEAVVELIRPYVEQVPPGVTYH